MKDFHLNTRNKKTNAIAQLMIKVQRKTVKLLYPKDPLLHWH